MKSRFRQIRWRVLTHVAVVSIVAVVSAPVRAQEDGFRLINGAIIGPKAAYVPAEAEFVCARTAQVEPSDTGQDVLIIHSAVGPARSLTGMISPGKRYEELIGNGQSVIISLILWGSDNHAATVWRGAASMATGSSTPTEISWLPGTRMALVQIINQPGPVNKEAMQTGEVPYTVTYLRVNGATGKTQTLLSGMDKASRLLVSPTEPIGILLSKDGKAFRRVSATSLTALVTLSGDIALTESDTLFWYGWLNDGKTVRGSLTRTAEDGKRTRVSVLLDTTTGTLSAAPAKLPAVPAPAAGEPALPFVVQRGKETLTRDGVKTEVYPLWLEGRDKDLVGRTLIAADTDPNFKPIVLTNSILYRKGGSIYAVPILKSDVAEFLARRKEAQKQETIQRAKQLGTAMVMYAEDSDENFPPVGSNVKDLIMPYLKNETLFQSPVTGQNGFTPVYTSTSLSGFDTPASTPLGYLSGPDGVAVIFVDGHVKWQDGQPKP